MSGFIHHFFHWSVYVAVIEGYPTGASNWSSISSVNAYAVCLHGLTQTSSHKFPSASILSHVLIQDSQMTFPSRASSSSFLPTFGTSTPHLRSLVTALGLNPSPSILGSMISPFSVMTAFDPHFPLTRAFCIHSSSLGCNLSSLTQAWVEGRTEILWVLFRLHLGCNNSVGEENVKEHLSHWSPRAS